MTPTEGDSTAASTSTGASAGAKLEPEAIPSTSGIQIKPSSSTSPIADIGDSVLATESDENAESYRNKTDGDAEELRRRRLQKFAT